RSPRAGCRGCAPGPPRTAPRRREAPAPRRCARGRPPRARSPCAAPPSPAWRGPRPSDRRPAATRGRRSALRPRECVAWLPRDYPPTVAEIDFVPDEHGGMTVTVDGHPQSHVDLEDPEGLVFEYVQHMAAVIDAGFPRPDPIGVTHVGGAGLTLARWVHATRPGSPQIVLEPDEQLTAQVRERLPLPRG